MTQGNGKKFTTASSVTLDGTSTGVQNYAGAIPTSFDATTPDATNPDTASPVTWN